MPGQITEVPGITVGCWTDHDALTGCTVVLCPDGAVVAADVRGGAPGTRDLELARPGMLVREAHAVVLTGGSAFGLDAAGGVMRWLEARGQGLAFGGAVVPIVPAAVVFDLGVGRARVRPGAAEGYAACERASRAVPEGNVGAGAGCTVGKLLGLAQAMRGGQGTAALRVAGRYTVGALVVVNAAGDVIDPATGRIVAGARRPEGGFAGPEAWRSPPALDHTAGTAAALNTTIGVIATDAPLSKEMAQRVAWMAHDGLARAVRPAHTLFDGDTLFVLSTAHRPATPGADHGLESVGRGVADDDWRRYGRLVNALGAAAADAVTEAIVRAVEAAAPLEGLPSASDWRAV